MGYLLLRLSRPISNTVSTVRDEATRSRFQTTLQPFLKLRTPRPESVQFITNFARRTGDLQVLSKPDLHLLALTYDLEVERNGGDVGISAYTFGKRLADNKFEEISGV